MKTLKSEIILILIIKGGVQMKKKKILIWMSALLLTAPASGLIMLTEPVTVKADEIESTIESGSYHYTGRFNTDVWFYNWDDENKTLTISDSADDNVVNDVTPLGVSDTIYKIKGQAEKIIYKNIKMPEQTSNLLFCCTPKEIDVSQADFSETKDMSDTFLAMSELESVNLSGINASNVTDMSSLFADCHRLKNVNLSGINTSNVTNMSSMFFSCYELENIDVSDFDTSNVTSMSAMFQNTAIRNLDLSNFETSKVTNMSSMFYDCMDLKKLDISNFTVSENTNSNIFGRMSYTDYCGMESLDIIQCPKIINSEIKLPYIPKYSTNYFDTSDLESDTVFSSLKEENEGSEVRCCRRAEVSYNLDDLGYVKFSKKNTGDTEIFSTHTFKDVKVGQKFNVLNFLNNNYDISDYDLISDEICTIGADPITNVSANFKTKEYTVNFINDDGTVLKSEKVKIHNSATAPENPIKPDDDRYTYDFKKWDKPFKNIIADTDVTALYKATPVKPDDKPTPVKPDEPNTITPAPAPPVQKLTAPAIPVKNDVPDTSDTGTTPYLLSFFFGILAIIKAKIFKK